MCSIASNLGVTQMGSNHLKAFQTTFPFQFGVYSPKFLHLPFPCLTNPGNEARAEVDHAPIDSGHVSIRVEHHRLHARCWRVTSWSGRPRKTSVGRYRRNSPQRGHSTVMDWNGNSLTPDGTSRRHCLQVTTKTLRAVMPNPNAMRNQA